jgi:lipoprotein-releasing system permease protein
LYDLNDSVHGLFVMLKDPYQAAEVKQQLITSLGDEFYVSTWMEQNSTILNALIVEKNVMFYLLFFIVLVAALCILSAQITFVVQKTREIGMLKALGATNLQISGVFLSQSAIIGVLGVLAGYGLGILALTYRNEFLHFMNRLTGWELFPASIYNFSELPAIIDTRDIVLICGSSFVICILGGVLPAWRAGRLKPVEALRYE